MRLQFRRGMPIRNRSAAVLEAFERQTAVPLLVLALAIIPLLVIPLVVECRLVGNRRSARSNGSYGRHSPSNT